MQVKGPYVLMNLRAFFVFVSLALTRPALSWHKLGAYGTFSFVMVAVELTPTLSHFRRCTMADNENMQEKSTNLHVVLGALVFVGVALLPAVLAVIQMLT